MYYRIAILSWNNGHTHTQTNTYIYFYFTFTLSSSAYYCIYMVAVLVTVNQDTVVVYTSADYRK